MLLLKRILLLLWASVALYLIAFGAAELWLLLEGAVRKPHNSRLAISVCFALGAAIAGAVIGAWRGRRDAFQALQIFSVLSLLSAFLYMVSWFAELSRLSTAEVRGWNGVSMLSGLLQALLWVGFALATYRVFRTNEAKSSG